MFFVDWLTVSQDFPDLSDVSFNGGRVISVIADDRRSARVVDCSDDAELLAMISGGSVDSATPVYHQHVGSWQTQIAVKMDGGRLVVSGNPSAYGRLDNVFGVDLDRAFEVYNGILSDLGLPEFSACDPARVWSQERGEFVTVHYGARISRIDVTVNLMSGMGNARDVLGYLASQRFYRTATDQTAAQSAAWGFSTVPLASGQYMSAKAYDKSSAIDEVTLPRLCKRLRAQGRADGVSVGQTELLIAQATEYLTQLSAWCASVGLVRLEYTFKSRMLTQTGLCYYSDELWDKLQLKAFAEYQKIVGRFEMSGFTTGEEKLTDKEFRVLKNWESGVDLGLSKSAFYRFRSSILEKVGADISAPNAVATNVRPRFVRVAPVLARDIPAWYRMAG